MDVVVLHMRSILFVLCIFGISSVARADDIRLAETDEFVLSVDAALLGAVSGVAALFVAPAEHGHDGEPAPAESYPQKRTYSVTEIL